MKFYWVSFYAPGGDMQGFEYHGPWWVSGYEMNEDLDHGVKADVPIIVAAVMATDEAAAYETLRLAFDEQERPRTLRERFANEKDWGEPYSDRFPKASWMKWPWPTVPLQPRPDNPEGAED